MFKNLIFFIGFLSMFSFSYQALIGGLEKLSKEEFTSRMSGNFVNLINEKLFKAAITSPENKSPLKFYSYVCGTKQVVAGELLQVEFLACARNTDKTCNFGQPPSKCTMKIWLQPGMDEDQPLNVDEGPSCDFIRHIGSAAECSLTEKSKIDVNNRFSTVLSMEKKPAYDEHTKVLFDKFIEDYGKDYSNDANEYGKRFKIFAQNLKTVKGLNQLERGSAVYGVTEFMDYTEDEFKKYHAPGLIEKKVEIRQMNSNEISVNKIPDSFDWRKLGAVTKVKNQGQCGSCWAFSTTGNIEGQWYISKKKLVSLSEQELVDCDKLDQGCEGGLPSNAYKQIEKLGGLETEADYPYDAADESCKIKKSKIRVFINDSIALPSDEGKMASWLVPNGPISIGINANVMQFYFGGISHPWKILCNPNKLDHGVLIVGYGEQNNTPFWIIKNSWGASWGEQGYYRIYRGDGSCGVNKMPTSAIIH